MEEMRSTRAVLESADAWLSSIQHSARADLAPDEKLALMRLGRRVAERFGALAEVLTDEANRAGAAMRTTGTPLTSLLALDEQRDAREAAGQVFHAADVTKHAQARDAALAGDISQRHAAAITKAMSQLPAELPAELAHRAAEVLVHKAKELTPRKVAQLAPLVLAEIAPELAPSPQDRAARVAAQRERAVQKRYLNYGSDGDGSLWFNGSLPETEAAPFIRHVEAYVERDKRAAAGRLDGLRTLTAGPKELRHHRALDIARSLGQRRADALTDLVADVRDAPSSIGDRPRLVVTVSLETLRGAADSAGVLPSGQELTPGQLRRICCDADVVPAVLGSKSEILDVGRSHRLVTPAIRRSLSLRDGGCVFPHCSAPDTACEAHHIVPWGQGGSTALSNLVLLCRHHHALIEPDQLPDRVTDRWRVSIDSQTGQPMIAPPRRFRSAEAERRGSPNDTAAATERTPRRVQSDEAETHSDFEAPPGGGAPRTAVENYERSLRFSRARIST